MVVTVKRLPHKQLSYEMVATIKHFNGKEIGVVIQVVTRNVIEAVI